MSLPGPLNRRVLKRIWVSERGRPIVIPGAATVKVSFKPRANIVKGNRHKLKITAMLAVIFLQRQMIVRGFRYGSPVEYASLIIWFSCGIAIGAVKDIESGL